MLATARAELNLSPAEFWELTPRELEALSDAAADREKRIEERNDRRLAELMAAISNAPWFKKADGSRFVAEDFLRVAVPKHSPQTQTGEQKLAIISTIMQHWQGIFRQRGGRNGT